MAGRTRVLGRALGQRRPTRATGVCEPSEHAVLDVLSVVELWHPQHVCGSGGCGAKCVQGGWNSEQDVRPGSRAVAWGMDGWVSRSTVHASRGCWRAQLQQASAADGALLVGAAPQQPLVVPASATSVRVRSAVVLPSSSGWASSSTT